MLGEWYWCGDFLETIGMTTDDKRRRYNFVGFTLAGVVARKQENIETGEVRYIGPDGAIVPVIQHSAQIATVGDDGRIERVLARYPIVPRSRIFTNPLPDLLAFHKFIAVDATPEMDGGEKTGRWAIVWVRMRLSDDGGQAVIQSGDICDIVGPTQDPEKIGWAMAVDWTMKQPDYQTGERIALISDAHLGEHGAVNARSEYLPGLTLPDGFVLCFGKQKSPRDSIFQFGIKRADQIGRRYLRDYPPPSADEYQEGAAGAPFKGICFVDLNVEQSA